MFVLVIVGLFAVAYLYSLYERYEMRLSYRFMKYYGVGFLNEPHRSNDPKIVIFIHYDFTIGKEIDRASIILEISLRNSKNIFIHTHEVYGVFDFSMLEKVDDVIVLSKDGKYISLWELRNCNGLYTAKDIRDEHNLERLLRSGSLRFIEYDKTRYRTIRKF